MEDRMEKSFSGVAEFVMPGDEKEKSPSRLDGKRDGEDLSDDLVDSPDIVGAQDIAHEEPLPETHGLEKKDGEKGGKGHESQPADLPGGLAHDPTPDH